VESKLFPGVFVAVDGIVVVVRVLAELVVDDVVRKELGSRKLVVPLAESAGL
jgi:hypothetical protein